MKMFYKCLPGVVLLLIWQGAVLLRPSYEFFIGAPWGIINAFFLLNQETDLAYHFAVTAIEAILGFAFGTVLGTAIGVFLWSSERTYQIAKPYLIILGALPVFALGPMLIFWFGTGLLSKIVLGFLITFSVAVSQAYEGGHQTDSNLITMARVYGANERRLYWSIVFPSSLIWVLMGIRINIGMALIAAFVGEFISSRAGLGHLIIVAEGLYNVNQIWVGVILISVLALLFNMLATPIERKAKSWKT